MKDHKTMGNGKKKNGKIKDALRLLRDSFRMSPANYVTLTIMGLVESARSVFQMTLPAVLIDRITGAGAFGPVIKAIFLYGLVILLADASQKALSLFSTAFGYKAGNRAALFVGQKGMRIDYGGWEDTETYEKMLKAVRNSWIFQNMADLMCENWLAAVMTLVPVLYILSYVNVFLLAPLFCLLAAELFLERKADSRIYELEESRAGDEKKLHYNEKVMTDLKYGKEIRLYGAMEDVMSKYEESGRKVFQSRKRQKKVEIRFRICAAGLACLESVLIYLAAVREYGKGAIAISFFLLFVGAVRLFTESMKTIVENFVWIRDLTDYYGDYRNFMEEPENFLSAKGSCQVPPAPFDIEFRNVSFRYPGTDNYVIKNLNLTFPRGKKIAVVGENGGGKTTLIKLLLRLYDVTEGEILAGGVNIKELEYESYLKLFSVVFQDCALHSYSVRENLSFQEKGQDELLWELLGRQGLEEAVRNTKMGLDTFVTKELDKEGKDFSGGEKQRLAMVRALYKNGGIYVLDEPASAIDPLAELEYFENLRRETRNKTAVFVTHRMASAKFADYIVVLDGGQAAETGDFDTLVKAGGIFASLFRMQAEYYE